jgi:hypothetical protein
MNEPNQDWLDQELKRLPDLEAPPELLPEVMRSVRRRAIQRWLMSICRQHLPIIRNAGLGLALALVVLFPFVNPGAAVSEFFDRSPLFHFLFVMLEVGRTVLTNLRVFELPVVWLVGLVAGISYLTCICAATTVRHLAAVRRL